MKKLALEDLQVDSFETMPEETEGRGTVRAHDDTDYGTCYPRYTCTGACESGPGVGCTQTCHPFTCSESYDYTFCDCDTLNDYTCPGNC
ncbi:MAG TPA: hypothetical protein VFQ45_18315 [Longimicrobium sp.]|nr:hypothetical protein [Longimicrobium sp.]